MGSRFFLETVNKKRDNVNYIYQLYIYMTIFGNNYFIVFISRFFVSICFQLFPKCFLAEKRL